MLFEEFNCLFFHIGKTAGTAIERWLFGPNLGPPYEPNRKILYGWDPEERVFLHHASAPTVLRLIGENAFVRRYKFSVVRNPYDRLVSVYYYLLREAHQKQYGSFQNFVRALPKLAVDPQLTKGSHYIPQTWYTHLESQCICDDLVYFEALPQALDPIRSKLGITRPFLKQNTYRHKSYPKVPTAEMYDQEMLHIMQDVYASDFEEYAYSFDPAVRDHTRTIQLNPHTLAETEWAKLVITPRPDIEVEVVDGTPILFNAFTQVRHSLSPVALFLWKLFTPEHTLPQIQSALCKQYQVGAETARHDLLELVTQLRKVGLVQVKQR